MDHDLLHPLGIQRIDTHAEEMGDAVLGQHLTQMLVNVGFHGRTLSSPTWDSIEIAYLLLRTPLLLVVTLNTVTSTTPMSVNSTAIAAA